MTYSWIYELVEAAEQLRGRQLWVLSLSFSLSGVAHDSAAPQSRARAVSFHSFAPEVDIYIESGRGRVDEQNFGDACQTSIWRATRPHFRFISDEFKVRIPRGSSEIEGPNFIVWPRHQIIGLLFFFCFFSNSFIHSFIWWFMESFTGPDLMVLLLF